MWARVDWATVASSRLWVAAWLLICAVSLLALPQQPAFAACVLGGLMLAITIADAERFIIPDVYSLPAIPLGLLATGYLAPAPLSNVALLQHLFAAAVWSACFYGVAVAYRWWRGREGLGLGDVKLVAVAGAWNGLEGGANVILIASLTALAFVLIIRLAGGRKLTRETELPFGAFLAPSIWFVWLWDHYSGAIFVLG